jgi:hypothetical protein
MQLLGQLIVGDEARRARAAGIRPDVLRHMRSLLDENGRNLWELGDLLVRAYGPASTPGVSDGSRRQIAALAELLSVSTSAVVQWRATASAWPRRERRPSAPWAAHAILRTHDDRVIVLDRFLDDCRRAKTSPTCHRLELFLGDVRPSRPALIEDRLLRLAGKLDHDRLAVVIDRLQMMLATPDGAVVAA